LQPNFKEKTGGVKSMKSGHSGRSVNFNLDKGMHSG